METPTLESLSR